MRKNMISDLIYGTPGLSYHSILLLCLPSDYASYMLHCDIMSRVLQYCSSSSLSPSKYLSGLFYYSQPTSILLSLLESSSQHISPFANPRYSSSTSHPHDVGISIIPTVSSLLP